MSSVIIVENLSKKYVLKHQARQGSYVALRDVMSEGVKNLGRRLLRGASESGRDEREDFWALQDVSFQVRQGDRVGIIGRNGAGKSTLLKILSRITEPTAGCVRIRGRVASLLEVGTGFHPELTGRENIYLNGAILGMGRSEIRRKFDEIVDFAEIERFLDTPVKRYSSGMYVRLAFAVASHLEPDILVVDEVLAVGDALFQKKCLGKMEDVSTREGRTVLLVSHNMQAIRQMCNRAVLLHAGRLLGHEVTSVAVESYLQQGRAALGAGLAEQISRLAADECFVLDEVRILQHGEPVETVANGAPVEIQIHYRVLRKTSQLRVFFDLYDRDETLLFRSFHDEDPIESTALLRGSYVSRATIPADLLAPIEYELRILATVYNVRMCIPYPGVCVPLKVERTGRSNAAYLMEPIRGKIAPWISWETSFALAESENRE
jgi:lipopolysaccharide transport system ATP-binding protein